MDVILLERVEKLGQIGDVVKVKPGFARNFLLPQKKALRATEDNKAKFEAQRAQIEANNLKRGGSRKGRAPRSTDSRSSSSARPAKPASSSARSPPATSPTAVTAAGFTVDRRQVILDRPIKTLGLHPVRVALHPEVDRLDHGQRRQVHEEAEAQEKAGGYVGRVEEAPAADLDTILAEADAAVAEEKPAEEAEEKK